MADLDFSMWPVHGEPGMVRLKLTGVVPADVGSKIFNLIQRSMAQQAVPSKPKKTKPEVLRIAGPDGKVPDAEFDKS
jgi:hypothetical protein